MSGDLWASQWSADYEQGIPVTPAPAAGHNLSVANGRFPAAHPTV